MRLYDTLSGEVREFTAQDNKVRMYNCGPTVYRRQHLGNFRAFATADLVRRTLEYLATAPSRSRACRPATGSSSVRGMRSWAN